MDAITTVQGIRELDDLHPVAICQSGRNKNFVVERMGENENMKFSAYDNQLVIKLRVKILILRFLCVFLILD